MRRWSPLLLSTLMMMMGAVMAETPKYEPVAAQLFQQREGLPNFFAKIKAGGEVRVAYFGGSITAAPGWRVQTLKWLQETYPQAQFSEINAAIGGTGSDLGVFRCRQDVLSKKPDLIFVEFAVNDGSTPPPQIWRCMEGILRQTWTTDPHIDICYVYTFRVGYEKDLQEGRCPQAASADELLAAYHGIPSVNVALRTVQLAQEGKLIYVPEKDAQGQVKPTPEGVILFSTDGVHPLTPAHQVYTDTLAQALRQLEAFDKPVAHELKAPFVADHWEQAKLAPLQASMLSAGWRKLPPEEGLAARFRHFMPEMWQAEKPGEKISFRFRGTTARLYDILGPDGAQVVVTLDGKVSPPRPRFDKYCSYHRLATLGIGEGLEDKVHEVTVEIHPDQPDRSSVTDIEKTKPNFDPKKYDGTVLRVGSIMLIGDLAP